jgi:exoribonuclease R
MNLNGEINKDSIKFNKIIMNSCCKFDYDTVQEIIKGKNITYIPKIYNNFTFEKLKENILLMNKLAISLRNKRELNGSLFLSNEELIFETNDEGYPINLQRSNQNESHQLIEEFMLMANMFAGEKIYNTFDQISILRTHSSPDQNNWEESMKKLIDSYNKNVLNENHEKIDFKKLLENGSTQNIMNFIFNETKNNKLIFETFQHSLLKEMKIGKTFINIQ